MMRLAMTPGEPAGIGPELLVRYCHEAQHSTQQTANSARLVAIANADLLSETAHNLGLALKINTYSDISQLPPITHHQAASIAELDVIDVPLAEPCQPGQLNIKNAPYVVETLRLATDACLSKQLDGLVTGPVQKSVINDAGIAFSGHTEFLAERAKREKVVMMLATQGLRVALATTHLPLRDVADAITQDSLNQIIDILHADLIAFFGLTQPKILVCGLNPHAGEGGHLGMEEITIISPLLERKRKAGMNITGPLPADTLFTPHHLKEADAVLAMYHDQGLPVLKYAGFGAAVNITLGLPFIRTSVDHGTALDLAGKGIADTGSLLTAIRYASDMAQTRISAHQ